MDWSCTRITRLIKDPNQQQQCKELLKSNYKWILEAYKYYSSINVNNRVPSVASNVFTDFVNEC